MPAGWQDVRSGQGGVTGGAAEQTDRRNLRPLFIPELALSAFEELTGRMTAQS
jgi:hypothetical protein